MESDSFVTEDLIARLKWAWDSHPLLDPGYSREARIRGLLSPFTNWASAAARFREIHEARRTSRLGETFEGLVRAVLDTYPDVATVVPNLPLPNGEVDVLFSLRSAPRDFIALELAVKFYLFDPVVKPEEQRWIGPARRDFLSRKVRRIFDLQVPRALTAETLVALQRRVPEAERIVESGALVRGELFVHPGDEAMARAALDAIPGISSPHGFSPWYFEEGAPPFRWLPNRWEWICEAGVARPGSAPESQDRRARMVLLDHPKRRAFVAPREWRDRQPPDSM